MRGKDAWVQGRVCIRECVCVRTRACVCVGATVNEEFDVWIW